MCLTYKSSENTVGKGEIALTSNFSFSPSAFYVFGEPSVIFNKFEIVVCKLFWVWKNLNCVQKLLNNVYQIKSIELLSFMQSTVEHKKFHKQGPRMTKNILRS